MAVSDKDKRVVLDALEALGATDEESAKGAEHITGNARASGPIYSNKSHISNILQVLVGERKVIRVARQKTAIYYISPEAPKQDAPVEAPAQTDEPQQDQSQNPFL